MGRQTCAKKHGLRRVLYSLGSVITLSAAKYNIAHLNDDLPEGHRKVTVCDQKIQEVQQPLLVYSDQHPVMTSPKSPS